MTDGPRDVHPASTAASTPESTPARHTTATVDQAPPRCLTPLPSITAPDCRALPRRASRPLNYTAGMADSSFDIVSKVDKMEADNAVNQAQKEIAQRYDFKNVGASVEWSGEKLMLKASAEERVKAVLEVLEQKFIKRGISLRSLDAGDPYPSGKEYRIEVSLKNGISSDDAKKVSKIIRDEGPKSIKSQIQGDELRVQSKSRDDLQATMALLKGKDLDIALQFVNFR
jgi:cyclic-di-GMP-binding protein